MHIGLHDVFILDTWKTTTLKLFEGVSNSHSLFNIIIDLFEASFVFEYCNRLANCPAAYGTAYEIYELLHVYF